MFKKIKKRNARLRLPNTYSGFHCLAEPEATTVKNLVISELLNSCQFPASDALVQTNVLRGNLELQRPSGTVDQGSPLLHDNRCFKISQWPDSTSTPQAGWRGGPALGSIWRGSRRGGFSGPQSRGEPGRCTGRPAGNPNSVSPRKGGSPGWEDRG